MTKHPILFALAAALACAPAFAQSSRLTVPKSADVFNPSDPLNGGVLPSKDALDTPPLADPNAEPKKDKGPTEITSGEATFDQKAHIAVFLTDVEVKDPEFNVTCDKLTAHLKHDDAKPGPNGAKPPPKPVAVGPKPRPGDPDPAKKSGGGLESADAEMNPGGRVTITQDKKEADGTITHSIGHGTKAHYNAITGDIQLTGRPDVKKGTDWVIATDDSTVITLNRDGRMSTKGPTKTVIIDKGDSGLK